MAEYDEYLEEYFKDREKSEDWMLELGAGKSTEVLARYFNVVSVDRALRSIDSMQIPDNVIFLREDIATMDYNKLDKDFKFVSFDLGLTHEEKAMNLCIYFILKSKGIIKPSAVLLLDNTDWEWMRLMVEVLKSEGYGVIDEGGRQCVLKR